MLSTLSASLGSVPWGEIALGAAKVLVAILTVFI